MVSEKIPNLEKGTKVSADFADADFQAPIYAVVLIRPLLRTARIVGCGSSVKCAISRISFFSLGLRGIVWVDIGISG